MTKTYFILLITLAISITSMAQAQTKLTPEEKKEARKNRNNMADSTIKNLLTKHKDLQKNLDSSAGYMVTNWNATKVPVLGTGKGNGVIVDSKTNQKIYVDVTRYALGGGLGNLTYKNLLVVQDQKLFDELKEGYTHYGMNAGIIFDSSSNLKKEYKLYMLLEDGASATATVERLNISVDDELTPRESLTRFPNAFGERSVTNSDENITREWEYAMPFMAQKVIDKGFDLPLPYGVAAIYANITQEMILTDLEVGYNNNGLIPIEFVSFSDAEASNDSLQFKADMWLFPFMNVYLVAGGVKGGAKLNFTIEGDGLLDLAGIDCRNPSNKLICKKLQDDSLTVSLGGGTGDINGDRTEYSGYNVGIGTIFAAGYKDWFVALPISYIYSDMDILDSIAETLNVAPRVGKTIDMGSSGTFTPFIGATYLDVEMDVYGDIYIGIGDIDTIEYKIHQKNTDKWNATAGFNWEYNKNLSWNLEAGFWGSRETIITGLSYRF